MAGELDPRDRRELFLAGIAAGDASGLPDPESREEMYLGTIASRQIPPYPTEDGTYILTLTIADGVASLSWVATS